MVISIALLNYQRVYCQLGVSRFFVVKPLSLTEFEHPSLKAFLAPNSRSYTIYNPYFWRLNPFNFAGFPFLHDEKC